MKLLSLFQSLKKTGTSVKPVPVNSPKYIIRFINSANPTIPYYTIAGQPENWIVLPKGPIGLYYDPVEDTPEYKRAIRFIKKSVDKELGDRARTMGACHMAWAIQKRILKERYGIEWHSPSELNPLCHFD